MARRGIVRPYVAGLAANGKVGLGMVRLLCLGGAGHGGYGQAKGASHGRTRSGWTRRGAARRAWRGVSVPSACSRFGMARFCEAGKVGNGCARLGEDSLAWQVKGEAGKVCWLHGVVGPHGAGYCGARSDVVS